MKRIGMLLSVICLSGCAVGIANEGEPQKEQAAKDLAPVHIDAGVLPSSDDDADTLPSSDASNDSNQGCQVGSSFVNGKGETCVCEPAVGKYVCGIKLSVCQVNETPGTPAINYVCTPNASPPTIWLWDQVAADGNVFPIGCEYLCPVGAICRVHSVNGGMVSGHCI